MKKIVLSIVAIAVSTLFVGCAQQTCDAKPAPVVVKPAPTPVVVKPAPVPVVVDEKSASVR